MMEKEVFTRPAMQIYPNNIMGQRKYKAMTFAERGLLFALVCESWTNGAMPNDIAELAIILSKSVKEISETFTENVKSFLTIDGENFTVNLVEYHREEQRLRAEKNAENGRKGGLKAHNNDTKKPKSKKIAEQDDIPYAEIQELYNDIMLDNPACLTLTEARKSMIRARWNDKTKTVGIRQNLEYWRKVFTLLSKSDFLTGKTPSLNGKAPFRATFDWIFKLDNFVKIIEGTYDNR